MACWLLPMRSLAMRRVSSAVRGRGAPADASLPLISTSGGFPGEKKRSLTLAEVRSMTANRSGVGMRTGAGATAAALAAAAAEAGAAAAAAGTGTGIFGGRIVGEDIRRSNSFQAVNSEYGLV